MRTIKLDYLLYFLMMGGTSAFLVVKSYQFRSYLRGGRLLPPRPLSEGAAEKPLRKMARFMMIVSGAVGSLGLLLSALFLMLAFL